MLTDFDEIEDFGTVTLRNMIELREEVREDIEMAVEMLGIKDYLLLIADYLREKAYKCEDNLEKSSWLIIRLWLISIRRIVDKR